MIKINGEEKTFHEVITIPEDFEGSFLERQAIIYGANKIGSKNDYLTVEQAYDEALAERQLNRELENIFDAATCTNLDEIRQTISDQIGKKAATAIDKIGALKQFRYKGNQKELQIVAINNLINSIFLMVNKVIINYPNDARLILSGEFEIFDSEIPLLVVLKLLHALSRKVNAYSYLDLDMQSLYTKIIAYSENLAFPSGVNKGWHINESIFENISSADVSIQIAKKNYKDSYYTKNSEGELVTNSYNSTISTYNELFSTDTDDKLAKMNGYDLFDDIDKYPELICDNIWTVKIINRTYEWGSWQEKKSTSTVCLFKEQEEKLRTDYARLLKYKEQVKKEQFKNDVEQSVLPYLDDKDLIDFKLISGLPWEEECLMRMSSYLEYLYNMLEEFRITKKGISLRDALEEEAFANKIFLTINTIVNIDLQVKEFLANTIVEKYCAKQKISDRKIKDKLINYCEKFALAELIKCKKKINSKLCGHYYLKKKFKLEEE